MRTRIRNAFEMKDKRGWFRVVVIGPFGTCYVSRWRGLRREARHDAEVWFSLEMQRRVLLRFVAVQTGREILEQFPAEEQLQFAGWI